MNENELYNTDFIKGYREEVKIKKRRKHKFMAFILLMITLFCIYLVTPFSKIKNISIIGESMYTDAQISEMIGLYPKQISIFNPSFMIEYNLNKTGKFKSVKVNKDNGNNVYIRIEESRLLLVQSIKGKYVFYDENNNVIEIEESQQSRYLSKTPYIVTNIDDEKRAALIKALKEAEPLTVAQISEIKPLDKAYDDVYRFTMNGNKRIYIETDLSKLKQLSQGYSKIVADTTNSCSMVKIVSDRAVVSKC